MKITPSLVFVVHLLVVLAPGNTKVISKIYSPLGSQTYVEPEKTHDEPKSCACSNEQTEPQIFRTHIDEYEDMESALKDIAMQQLPFLTKYNHDISYNEYPEQEKVSSAIPPVVDTDSNSITYQVKSEETALNPQAKKTEDPNVIKQVIFIEPPEYIYKHEFNIQPAKKPPRTVIYVFPPQVKHQYNITDARIPIMMSDGSEPIVYYLNMDSHREHESASWKGGKEDSSVDENKLAEISADSIGHTLDEDKTIDIDEKQFTGLAERRIDEAKDAGKAVVRTIKSIDTSGSSVLKHEVKDFSTTKPPQLFQSESNDGEGSFTKITQPSAQIFKDSFYSKNTHTSTGPSPNYQNNLLHSSDITLRQNEETPHSHDSEFEIIPAILQSYFYIGPNDAYPL